MSANLPDCTYVGMRSGAAAIVAIRPGGGALPLRLDLVSHSPTGFEWGYPGSGPAQLALALLAHATGDEARAVELHQRFKENTVALWDRAAGWQISANEVRRVADALSGRPFMPGVIDVRPSHA